MYHFSPRLLFVMAGLFLFIILWRLSLTNQVFCRRQKIFYIYYSFNIVSIDVRHYQEAMHCSIIYFEDNIIGREYSFLCFSAIMPSGYYACRGASGEILGPVAWIVLKIPIEKITNRNLDKPSF